MSYRTPGNDAKSNILSNSPYTSIDTKENVTIVKVSNTICPICSNPISIDNKLLSCKGCSTKFCELCDSKIDKKTIYSDGLSTYNFKSNSTLCKKCFRLQLNKQIEKIRVKAEKKKIEEKLPNDPKICYKNGIEYNTKNQYEIADLYFKRAIELDLGYIDKVKNKWIKIGDEKTSQGSFKNAIKCFDYAISVDLGFIDAWVKKGNALIKLGSKKEALQCYNKAIEINPDRGLGYAYIGLYYSNLNDLNSALKYVKKGTTLESDNEDVWLCRQKVHYKNHDYKQGIACSNKVLNINPVNIIALSAKWKGLTILMEHDKALKCSEKIIEIDRKNARGWVCKGSSLYMLHRYSNSKTAFKRALRIDSNGLTISHQEIQKYITLCGEKLKDTLGKPAWLRNGTYIIYDFHDFANKAPIGKHHVYFSMDSGNRIIIKDKMPNGVVENQKLELDFSGRVKNKILHKYWNGLTIKSSDIIKDYTGILYKVKRKQRIRTIFGYRSCWVMESFGEAGIGYTKSILWFDTKTGVLIKKLFKHSTGREFEHWLIKVKYTNLMNQTLMSQFKNNKPISANKFPDNLSKESLNKGSSLNIKNERLEKRVKKSLKDLRTRLLLVKKLDIDLTVVNRIFRRAEIALRNKDYAKSQKYVITCKKKLKVSERDYSRIYFARANKLIASVHGLDIKHVKKQLKLARRFYDNKNFQKACLRLEESITELKNLKSAARKDNQFLSNIKTKKTTSKAKVQDRVTEITPTDGFLELAKEALTFEELNRIKKKKNLMKNSKEMKKQDPSSQKKSKEYIKLLKKLRNYIKNAKQKNTDVSVPEALLDLAELSIKDFDFNSAKEYMNRSHQAIKNSIKHKKEQEIVKNESKELDSVKSGQQSNDKSKFDIIDTNNVNVEPKIQLKTEDKIEPLEYNTDKPYSITPGSDAQEKDPLEWGVSYIVEEDKPAQSLELFEKFVDHGRKTLMITRQHPEKVVKKYDLQDTTSYWLSKSASEFTLTPGNVSKISHVINLYIKENENAVVLLDGLEYLISNNDFSKILRFIDDLHEKIVLNNSILIMPTSASTLSDKEWKLLEKNMENLSNIDLKTIEKLGREK